ncbi:DNA replication/repair protein RecF [Tistrella sp. BH-R2-4]|uniref:DNA replication and repair protein RecF n=1 Tax=Tistrella arctica TaxID=3133430 RepID=A0ABU9YGA3_9PROT
MPDGSETPGSAGDTVPALTRLVLTGFRNYAGLRLALDPRPVVLTGANGAGKTNLLEAVSMLAPGRGLRGARLADMDRLAEPGLQGEPGLQVEPGRMGAGWAVAATVRTGDGPVEAGTGLVGGGVERERRVVRIDGRNASAAELGRRWSVLWVTPLMDRLFIDSAGNRRRFFDRLVYGLDPDHAGRIAAYEQAMRERARLLRDGRRDPAWLGALEATMAAKGVAIAAARLGFMRQLKAVLAAGDGAFPRARIAIEGEVEAALAVEPALAVEDRLAARLAECRGQDAEAGGTRVGPHRSDLVVTHDAGGMPAARCSTGEQKALLLAIVLAVARLKRTVEGSAPILLLDEVAAHLDAERRTALYDVLVTLGSQAWLTGTDRPLFAGLEGRAQFLRIADASAIRE